MGNLQSDFKKSANSALDNAGTLKLVNDKVAAFIIPDDFKGNPTEYRARMRDGLQRVLGDEYMLSIQNQKRFDLQATLNKIPNTETPSTLHERAATIENRVITAGEKIDPTQRLRNATMDTQQAYLEQAAKAIKEEKIKTGTVSPDGGIKDLAKGSYRSGLLPADVANYAILTEGVSIPPETMTALATVIKPEEPKKAVLAPTSSPAAAPASP